MKRIAYTRKPALNTNNNSILSTTPQQCQHFLHPMSLVLYASCVSIDSWFSISWSYFKLTGVTLLQGFSKYNSKLAIWSTRVVSSRISHVPLPKLFEPLLSLVQKKKKASRLSGPVLHSFSSSYQIQMTHHSQSYIVFLNKFPPTPRLTAVI